MPWWSILALMMVGWVAWLYLATRSATNRHRRTNQTTTRSVSQLAQAVCAGKVELPPCRPVPPEPPCEPVTLDIEGVDRLQFME